MIKALIFDFGGVMTTKGRGTPFCREYASKYGVAPEGFVAMWREEWHKARTGQIEDREFWDAMGSFLKVPAERFKKDFIDWHGWRPETLDYVRSVKGRFKLAMLSNQIKDWFEEFANQYDFYDLFDVIVVSYESKKAKPDIRIYKEVIQKLGVEPWECVLIDDQERNMPPAEQLGIHAILFTSVDEMKAQVERLIRNPAA